jgi:hypothetical protein
LPFTLDPYHSTIIEWKERQALIVGGFIDAWVSTPLFQRASYEFQVMDDPLERKYILFQGQRIAEFEVMAGDYLVFWVRSLEDLENLYTITKELKNDTHPTQHSHATTATL